MALISQYIEPISTGNKCIDTVVNEMVYPQIHVFCEIPAHYEPGARRRDGSYKFSYGNWNRAFEPEVFLNGSDRQLDPSMYSVDYDEGSIMPNYETAPGDNLICTYNFSWFRPETLAGYVARSMGPINFHGEGATTDFTVDTLPENLYGVSADLCISMAMENLIASLSMWRGKLLFALSPNDLYGGGSGDIQGQLELLKKNAEERAYEILKNPNTRAPKTLSIPTPLYWRAVTVGNGVRLGPHGGTYGRSRGIKINKLWGATGPDLGY